MTTYHQLLSEIQRKVYEVGNETWNIIRALPDAERNDAEWLWRHVITDGGVLTVIAKGEGIEVALQSPDGPKPVNQQVGKRVLVVKTLKDAYAAVELADCTLRGRQQVN